MMHANSETNRNASVRAETQVLLSVLNIISTVTNLSLGAVAVNAFVYASLWSYDVSTAIPVHIYVCVSGYVILMAQAILCMNPQTGWARSFSYRNKKSIHYVMQTTGSILVIAGTILVIVERGSRINAHGIVGIIAMVLTFVNLIFGFVNFLYSSGVAYNIKLYTVIHSILGCLTISVAFVAVLFGFIGGYRMVFGDTASNLLIAFTVISLFGILVTPLLNIRRSLRF